MRARYRSGRLYFIVLGGRNPCVEADAAILPIPVRTDRVEQLDRAAIRVAMPERRPWRVGRGSVRRKNRQLA